MICTERSCGSMYSWILRQVMPDWTVISFRSFENATTSSNCRMSICNARSVAVWPPWLKRPPPIDTGPRCERTASTISSIVVGTRTRSTTIGLIRVTSLTIAAPWASAEASTAQNASSDANRRLRKKRPHAIGHHGAGEDQDGQPQGPEAVDETARSEQVPGKRDDGENEHGDPEEDRHFVRAVARVDPEPGEHQRQGRDGVEDEQHGTGLRSTERAVLQAAEDQREHGEKGQQLRLRSQHRSDFVESHQGVAGGISILQEALAVGAEPRGLQVLLKLLQ